MDQSLLAFHSLNFLSTDITELGNFIHLYTLILNKHNELVGAQVFISIDIHQFNSTVQREIKNGLRSSCAQIMALRTLHFKMKAGFFPKSSDLFMLENNEGDSEARTSNSQSVYHVSQNMLKSSRSLCSLLQLDFSLSIQELSFLDAASYSKLLLIKQKFLNYTFNENFLSIMVQLKCDSIQSFLLIFRISLLKKQDLLLAEKANLRIQINSDHEFARLCENAAYLKSKLALISKRQNEFP